MRNTQRKGDIAVTQAIATMTRLGWDISIPITESAPYDLVVDVEGELFKIQVKYCGNENKEVDLRHVHSNSKGYVVSKTAEGSYDWLYVYSPRLGEFLVKECLSNRSSITLNEKYRL